MKIEPITVEIRCTESSTIITTRAAIKRAILFVGTGNKTEAIKELLDILEGK